MKLTGSIGKEAMGLKKRIAVLLESLGEGEGLSMGEIIARLDLDKSLASEVSSALYKLRGQQKVAVFEDKATSGLGRRVVRRYRWAGEASARPKTVTKWEQPAVAAHPLNSLFLRRI
jgi:hypothetical protein